MTAPTVPALCTDRLLLRPLRDADRDAVVRVFADPATSRWLAARTGFLNVSAGVHYGGPHRVLVALAKTGRGRAHG